MSPPTRYFVDVVGQRHEARRVNGREELSRTFRFDLELILESPPPDADDLVKAPATLEMSRGDAPLRRIAAVVTDARVSLTAERRSLHVTLEPRLALLRHRHDIRVFRNKSAIDIVDEVLAAMSIGVQRRLTSSYAPRPYCVQMRESDLDFASRLLEDEGVGYFLADDGTVVLCDSPAAHRPLEGPPLPFRHASGLLSGQDFSEEAVVEVERHVELSAGSVSFRDFNPERPSMNMDVTASVADSSGPEFYDYPGEYLDPADGARKAARLAEAFRAASSALSGRSTCGRLAVGARFDLTEAPVGIADGEYLVTALDHDFVREADSFVLGLRSRPADEPWRPERGTPEPQLPNPFTAVVTGPPGADVHTDPLGRVKVRMAWDRLQPYDDTTSDWVPVLQDNTGGSVGLMRVGWEVLVHFLEGDPDRPAVLGRLYNGADPFPEPLPEGKTRTALRSLSSPSRGGVNAIRFDDAAGAEQLFLHAEKDHVVVVANDKREDVLSNASLSVGASEGVSIGGNETTGIGADRSCLVAGDQSFTIAGEQREEVAASLVAEVGGDHSMTVASDHSRRIGTQDIVQAGSLSEQIGSLALEASALTNAISSGGSASFTVGGALIEAALEAKSEESKLARVETIGGVLLSKSQKATSSAARMRNTMVGGVLRVSATEAIELKAGMAFQVNAMLGRMDHTDGIMLKVGECSVTLKDGVLALSAPTKIVLKATNESLQASGLSTQNR